MNWFSRKPKKPDLGFVDATVSKPSRAIAILRAKNDIYAGHKLTPGGRPGDGARMIRKDFEINGDDPIAVVRPELFEVVGWLQDGRRIYIDEWAPFDNVPLIHEDN